MIIGLGTDIVELERIKRIYERYGQHFLERLLSPAEIAAMQKITIATLAGRFAAKEAASKALGTGFSQGINYTQIEIMTLDSGQPQITLNEEALARFQALGGARKHISISHGRDAAIATVIFES